MGFCRFFERLAVLNEQRVFIGKVAVFPTIFSAGFAFAVFSCFEISPYV